MAAIVADISDGLRELEFKTANSLYAIARSYSGTPSNFTVQTTNQTVFTLAEGEKGFIQNLHTTALAVKLGDSATNASFSLLLNGGVALNDGSGKECGIFDFIGPVSVAAMTGLPRYIAWKQSS